jgi:hypothetical protein
MSDSGQDLGPLRSVVVTLNTVCIPIFTGIVRGGVRAGEGRRRYRGGEGFGLQQLRIRGQPAQGEGEEQRAENGKPELGHGDPCHRRGGHRISR